jgi:superfamily II DNA or RNA helicase
MNFAVGSLVKARGREWVVLPESEKELLVLRPLGGTDDETTGIYLPLESVEPAQFELPSPDDIGDYRSCRLLRDAVRLGFRSSAGPFRSFAKIAVEPRPYQLVPLMMALKLDPIRLLIADDVGIGKTIEACLVARELMDRGEATRLAVLCPPHLAEQWQAELKDKFHIDAELVLSSTAGRLERNCMVGQSIFEVYPHVVVSMDFIKSDRRRDEFIRTCPELVIVDEAHTCSFADYGRGGRHQRFLLIKGLAEKPERHMILVTATPHSGKEDAFRSLLSFLDKDFLNLPEDLTGKENEQHRRRVAAHFVQRRRANIRHYMDAETPFPEREDLETSYSLSDEYKKLFARVLGYARETVRDPDTNSHRQRVRWWSALGLLRSLASSPAAAAETLRVRAATADTETPEEADAIGRRTVLDLEDDFSSEAMDIAPGCDIGEKAQDEEKNRRRLLEMARQAEKLKGDKDQKLTTAAKLVKDLLSNGFSPIVFCRFIASAEYVAEELRTRLGRNTEVISVTGTLPPEERQERVIQLAQSQRRVLVCTDCLSEGINLQDHFDCVFHYDLSWNPTRHEQREGRVDRFGQAAQVVRVLTYYGIDNQIDGIVLDVLLRKHKKIRSSLGISVPLPADTNQVVEAIFEGLLLREEAGRDADDALNQLMLPGFEEYFKPQKEDLFNKWESAAGREKRSRTLFAQESIKPDEVARELTEVRTVIGSGVDVEAFVREAVAVHGGFVSALGDKSYEFDLNEVPAGLRDAIGGLGSVVGGFQMPVKEGVLYLHRTHPVVEGIGSHVMDAALDPLVESNAKRAGVMMTSLVSKRTTLLLARFRYHIITKRGEEEHPLLAEDSRLLAFEGSPQNAQWLSDNDSEKLLSAQPEDNVTPDRQRDFLSKVINDFDSLRPFLDDYAKQRGDELLDAHQRVRRASAAKGIRYRIEPKLPVDVLGCYILLPKN